LDLDAVAAPRLFAQEANFMQIHTNYAEEPKKSTKSRLFVTKLSAERKNDLDPPSWHGR
jgi:hypothetical protein